MPDESKFCNNCGAPTGDDIKVEESDLDKDLKKVQMENEKKKGGCLTLIMGTFLSVVLLFTAGPIFAGINMVGWLIICLLEDRKK